MQNSHYNFYHKLPALLVTLLVVIAVGVTSYLSVFNSKFPKDSLPEFSQHILTDPVLSRKANTSSQASATTQQKLSFASSEHLKGHSEVYLQLQTIFKHLLPVNARLHQNERFSVIYDQSGHILLATLNYHKQTLQAIRYTNANGYTNYYTPKGKILFKPAFLAAPLKYTHISDPFTFHRWHPILHITRPHYGIDYAAPSGTPIRAISSGRVSFSGWNGGYGNTIVIEHSNHYQSLYAHIKSHGFLVKAGQRVAQGQIIGYVGSTGLATGPHLHFGMYEYGQAINPLIVLPKLNAPGDVPPRDLPNFLAQANRLFIQNVGNG